MIEVIKFGAEWCNPCKQLAPIIDNIKSDYPNITFTNVDVDNDTDELSGKYTVRSIPAVFIEKDGKVVDKFVGLKSEQEIRKMLDNL